MCLHLFFRSLFPIPIHFTLSLLKNSFDARTSDFEKGSHWLDEKSLGGRAYFQASATPASLIIDEAQDSDSGMYRCRVDFHKSPTRNSRVQLKIIRKC